MTQERATVLVSAVTALAILGAMVTAQAPRSAPVDQVTRLESDLRYQLDLEARLNRAAFEEGANALDGALAAWRKSPQSADDRAALEAWLREALVRSMPGGLGAWPATPEFSKPHVTKKEATSEKVVKDSPVRAPGELKGERPAEVADSPPTEPAAQKVVISVSEPQPIVPGEWPYPTQPTQAQPSQASDVQIEARREPLRAAVEGPKAIDASASPSNKLTDPPVADVAHLPAPTANQTAGAYRDHSAEVSPPPLAAVEVNLAELNARIGGYHDELREVEAALVVERKGMTVRRLEVFVSRLEVLAGQRAFVQLYYDALKDEERKFVRAPRPLGKTIHLVEQQAAQLEAAEADHFAAADEPADSGLTRRLKALAEMSGQ